MHKNETIKNRRIQFFKDFVLKPPFGGWGSGQVEVRINFYHYENHNKQSVIRSSGRVDHSGSVQISWVQDSNAVLSARCFEQCLVRSLCGGSEGSKIIIALVHNQSFGGHGNNHQQPTGYGSPQNERGIAIGQPSAGLFNLRPQPKLRIAGTHFHVWHQRKTFCSNPKNASRN